MKNNKIMTSEAPEVGYEYREDLYNLFINRFNTGGSGRRQNQYRVNAYNTGLTREQVQNIIPNYDNDDDVSTTLLLLRDLYIYEVGKSEIITKLEHVHIEVPKNLRKREKLLNREKGGRYDVLVNKYISFKAEISIYTRTNGTIDFSFRKISKIRKSSR